MLKNSVTKQESIKKNDSSDICNPKVIKKPAEKIAIIFKYWWRTQDIIDYCDVSPAQAYKLKSALRDDQYCKYNGDLVLRDAVLQEYLHSNKERELAIQLEQIEIENRLAGVITNG